MSKSIIQGEKVCFITGDSYNLHSHHIFGGSCRKLSEKYGLKIWLRADWHNMSNYGIHFDSELNNRVKKVTQKIAMAFYGWSTEDFIRIFGRNYID